MTQEQEQKTSDELAREARQLAAQASAQRMRETEVGNDPDRAQRLTEAIAEAEDPKRRSDYAREKHRNSPAFKEAKKYGHDALSEVREAIVQMRARDIDSLDPADRRDLIHRVTNHAPARMAEALRNTANRMLDDTTGDINRVDEIMRYGVLESADNAPYTFERPGQDEEQATVDAIVARVPRAT